MRPSNFHTIVEDFYYIEQKPADKGSLGQMFIALSSLTNEERGNDVESIQHVIRDLCLMGIDHLTAPSAHSKYLSPGEWLKFRETLEIYLPQREQEYTEPPGQSIPLDEVVASSSARGVLSNFISEIRMISSTVSLAEVVQNYVAIIELLSEQDRLIVTELKPVLKVLETHGWKWDHFAAGSPNKGSLITELENLLRVDDEVRSRPPQPSQLSPPLTSHADKSELDFTEISRPSDYSSLVISNLIDGLSFYRDPSDAVIEYFESIAGDKLDDGLFAVNQVLASYGCLPGDDYEGRRSVIPEKVDWKELRQQLSIHFRS